MVPLFAQNTPTPADLPHPTPSQPAKPDPQNDRPTSSSATEDHPDHIPRPRDAADRGTGIQARTIVGLRMPYALPLCPYKEGEEPWCANESHEERDWMGRKWVGRVGR